MCCKIRGGGHKESEILELGRHTLQIENKNTVYYDREKLPLATDGISIVLYDKRQESFLVWREYKAEETGLILYRNDSNLQEIWYK